MRLPLLLLAALLSAAFCSVRADRVEDVVKEATKAKFKAKLQPCNAYSVTGFEHNDWINTWVSFWRLNSTCSDNSHRCFSKPLDPLIFITNVHRKVHELLKRHAPSVARKLRSVPDDDSEGNVAYLLWREGQWLVCSSSTRPNERVYAQLTANTKRPKSSGKWEVYNGSAMERNNVTITCVDGTYWLRASEAWLLGYPYAFGILTVAYFILLCVPFPDRGHKCCPSKACHTGHLNETAEGTTSAEAGAQGAEAKKDQ